MIVGAFILMLGILCIAAKRRYGEFHLASPVLLALAVCGSSMLIREASSTAPRMLVLATLLAVLVVSSLTDVRTGYVFDEVNAIGAAVVLGCSVWGKMLPQALLGALLSSAPFFVIYVLTRGRGIGLGDAKLGAVIGLSLGAPLGPVSIACAFVIGASYAIARAAIGTSNRRSIPFVPFMSAGAALIIMFPGVISWLSG